jgi:hypothetical protein
MAERYPTIHALYQRLTKDEPCIRDTHPKTQADFNGPVPDY